MRTGTGVPYEGRKDMSFSSGVKDELYRIVPEARHCRIAEIAAVLSELGHLNGNAEEKRVLSVTTEHAGMARKYFTLLKKTYKIGTDVSVRKNTLLHRSHSYTVSIKRGEDISSILEGTKLAGSGAVPDNRLFLRENRVVSQTCCKRAFIRGAFLSAGSVSDPEKFYHFEIVAPDRAKAEQLKDIFSFFKLDAKIVIRKKSYIVYLKESDQIVEALGLMGASTAVMDFENIRIVKGMRNDVNRQVNCETANLSKTVSASVRQIRDIELIRDTEEFKNLPYSLREMAEIRIKNPQANLKELGEMLSPPVGKSGVNHRLRKLCGIAEEIRKNGNI
jgi:DNA-binding protein WhiA